MIRIFYFIALLCTAWSNPLGQTTVCESSPNLLSGLLPGYGATACETASVLPLPYGMGAGVGLGGIGYGLPYGGLASPLGATTVCETAPNMGVGYGMPMGGATTVCETSNTTPGLLGMGYGLPYAPLGGATVCETAPNMLGWGYGLPYGLGMGGVWGGMGGLGHPVGYGAPLGVGTVYETSPNLLGLGYMPGYGLGAPTPCEAASNMLGLGMGLSLGRPFL